MFFCFQKIPGSNRCIVTMIYYGPQLNVVSKRARFQPAGDEIVVMQQHCGGENVIAFKGSLKSDRTFQFESRRHVDYPFALTFYVNGLMDNRLSVCCESRYKQNVRIGGKQGLFGIINVEKSKACKRCRLEKRRRRLAKLRMKCTIHDEAHLSHGSTSIVTTSPPLTTEEQNDSSVAVESHLQLKTNKPERDPSNFNVRQEQHNESYSQTGKNDDDDQVLMSEKNLNNPSYKSIASNEKLSNDEITRTRKTSNADFNDRLLETNQNEDSFYD